MHIPIISVILVPETPLTTALLYGLVLTFLALWAIKIFGLIESWGLGFVILVTVGVALYSLPSIFVFRIDRLGVVGAVLLSLLLLLFKTRKH